MSKEINKFKHGEQIEMTVQVVVTKDQSTFGGPNHWNLCIRRPSDNFPAQVQWMDAGNIERILEIELPRYEETRKASGRIRPVKE